jgi:hypothetical protein
VILVSPAFHELALMTPVVLGTILWQCGTGGRARKARAVVLLGLPYLVWGIVLMSVSATYPSYGWTSASVTQVPLRLLRYLGFMVFPVQESQIAATQPAFVSSIAAAAKHIHAAAGAAILALLVLGGVKGERRFRVLVVWLLAALLPVTFVEIPGSWLELRYLYYASIPFCGIAAFVLARTGRMNSRLVRNAVITLVIIVTLGSGYLIRLLENKYDATSRSPENRAKMEEVRQLAD